MQRTGNTGGQEGRTAHLPGSKKIYIPGPNGIRVPMREIGLHPAPGLNRAAENTQAVRVYDTSGPLYGSGGED